MSTHPGALAAPGLRTLFHRRSRATTRRYPGVDATFGEWVNPAVRPRASQRLLAQTGR